MYNTDYEDLLEKFKVISNIGWIKGINNNTNSVGLTFENLINKKADSLFFPDYKGMEIKCTTRFSRFPISLFSLAFDGPSLYEINKILQKYGNNDSLYENKKSLLGNLKLNKNIVINDKYFFKLVINYKEERIYLNIYDIYYNLIESESYITFDSIRKHLLIKLSNLALVVASKKVDNDNSYFRYYKITIYKLKGFKEFLTSLEHNDITVNLVCRVSRSGEDKGRQKNKNLVFQIKKDAVSSLFEEIECYDMDKL